MALEHLKCLGFDSTKVYAILNVPDCVMTANDLDPHITTALTG